MNELITIQSRLKAPKSQYNSFGKYKYRNCEDILEAVKPLLAETNTFLTISDEIIQTGKRYYIKASVHLYKSDGTLISQVSALAREAETKKGMDESQLTGSTSSYARKYALNGLFAIDDTKDSDSDKSEKEQAEQKTSTAKQNETKPCLNITDILATKEQAQLIRKKGAEYQLVEDEVKKVVDFIKAKLTKYSIDGKLTSDGAEYIVNNFETILDEYNIEKALD